MKAHGGGFCGRVVVVHLRVVQNVKMTFYSGSECKHDILQWFRMWTWHSTVVQNAASWNPRKLAVSRGSMTNNFNRVTQSRSIKWQTTTANSESLWSNWLSWMINTFFVKIVSINHRKNDDSSRKLNGFQKPKILFPKSEKQPWTAKLRSSDDKEHKRPSIITLMEHKRPSITTLMDSTK